MKLKNYIRQGTSKIKEENRALIAKWRFMLTDAGRQEIIDQFEMKLQPVIFSHKVKQEKKEDGEAVEHPKDLLLPWPENERFNFQVLDAELLAKLDAVVKPTALEYNLINNGDVFAYYHITPNSRQLAKVVLAEITTILTDAQQAEFKKGIEKYEAGKKKK